jgi:hypothetical protein
MAQTLYSVTALLLLGISFFNVNQKVHGNQERLMFSELALEMTSVGAEMLNEIGKYSYDPAAISTVSGTTLNDRAALRGASTFGTGVPACAPDPASQFSGCVVINDFHGKTTRRSITRAYGGATHTIDYDVTDIRIRYVEEAPPHRPCSATGASCPASGKTFAKEATVTVSTPALVNGAGAPIAIRMSRVYLYPNHERGKPYSSF